MNLKRTINRVKDAKTSKPNEHTLLQEDFNSRFPIIQKQLSTEDDDISNKLYWGPLIYPEDDNDIATNEIVVRQNKQECSGEISWDGKIYKLLFNYSKWNEETKLWEDSEGPFEGVVSELYSLCGVKTRTIMIPFIQRIYKLLTDYDVAG